MTEKTQICVQCGAEDRCYGHEGRHYCRLCAHGLLSQLKQEYFRSGEAVLGWKIDDLWRQIVFDPRNPEYDEFRLEDASWLDEVEDEELENNTILAYAREDARELVRDFIAERLDGDLDKLKNFNLSSLENDAKYGQQTGNSFDADDCLLARAIYVLVWGDVFPYLNMLSVGSGCAYRGDTMNTFHTMFGREIPEQPGCYYGLENFHPDEKTRTLAGKFHDLVPTIGNYVVLPNYADENRKTINTYRGCHFRWRDYFDQFTTALEAVLTNTSEQDAGLRVLVRERNGYAFEKYAGFDGFRHLAEQLFLDSYLGEDGHAFAFNTVMTDKVMYHWMKPRPSDEEYLKGAQWYARNAIQIIHWRAERIVNVLAAKL